VGFIGAEPALGGDAAAWWQAGERQRWPREQVARTAADGLRSTALGELTWPHVRDLVADVLTVDEDAIADATRRLHAVGVPCEASGAVATAGWLALPPDVRARSTVAVVSGGNVDPAWLAGVLADRTPVPTFG
jgi:threonine dehydratase